MFCKFRQKCPYKISTFYRGIKSTCSQGEEYPRNIFLNHHRLDKKFYSLGFVLKGVIGEKNKVSSGMNTPSLKSFQI